MPTGASDVAYSDPSKENLAIKEKRQGRLVFGWENRNQMTIK